MCLEVHITVKRKGRCFCTATICLSKFGLLTAMTLDYVKKFNFEREKFSFASFFLATYQNMTNRWLYKVHNATRRFWVFTSGACHKYLFLAFVVEMHCTSSTDNSEAHLDKKLCLG